MLCNFYDDFHFSARWITLEGASDIPNCALQFFKEFTFTGQETPALLHITAESYYVVYVNGVFIGRGPVRGTATRQYIDTYDISPLLVKGKNRLGVLVQSMNSRANFNSSPAGIALCAEIPGILCTDESWHVRHLPGWENTTRPFSFQHGYKIQYDFRQGEGSAWLIGDGIDTWPAASLFSSPLLEAKQLRPRAIPELHASTVAGRKIKEALVELLPLTEDKDIAEILNAETWHDQPLSPAEDAMELPRNTGLAMIYDFGTPRIGFFETTITGNNLEGIRLDVTYGEELWNGRIRAKYPNPTYFFTDSYFLHSGTNHITHPFEMHGATMIQLVFRHETGACAHFSLTTPLCSECRYPYSTDARFRCSDPLLERIWTLCCETMSACTTDTFMDCPWREHAFWVNDLLIQNRATLAMFGPSDIHRRAFDLAFSQQTPDGWVPAVAPTNIIDGGPPTNILPATNLFLFWMLRDYLMSSADTKTVRSYLPNLEKILHAFENTRKKGDALVQPPSFGWNFYSWEFELNWLIFNNCRESMLNSLYICALNVFQELCGMLDYPCDRQWCTQRIQAISQTLRQEFFVEQDGVLQDPCFRVNAITDAKEPVQIRSELSQALALLSGVWSREHAEQMLEKLFEHSMLEPELYLSGLLFQALCEQGGSRGRTDALARIRKNWGEIVRRGCTTLPESVIYGFGREAFSESGSLCHGFGASPVVFFQKIILGIRPLSPGYRDFLIDPHALDLTYANGQIFTPSGTISVSWTKNGDALQITVDIPAGLTAHLPNGQTIAGRNTFELPASEE